MPTTTATTSTAAAAAPPRIARRRLCRASFSRAAFSRAASRRFEDSSSSGAAAMQLVEPSVGWQCTPCYVHVLQVGEAEEALTLQATGELGAPNLLHAAVTIHPLRLLGGWGHHDNDHGCDVQLALDLLQPPFAVRDCGVDPVVDAPTLESSNELVDVLLICAAVQHEDVTRPVVGHRKSSSNWATSRSKST